ncbi:Toll-Interleukin-Resistance domain family protein [Prunus dulcis]|uniref:Toll-Interleukin-Resistance domain family protein n=1 Tax=Prunus dulcis TaxID=3755 RepID=A0A4Y1RDR9_PRUDU|nr:Toll-Interleukin-Resistance domain family protein [Prunus dulcis]
MKRMRSYNYNVYDEPIKATSESAEWIFLATNLGLEMLSAACDQYVYCLRHANNPFKASLLPAIFLLCLGGSKLSNNRRNANTADNILRKPLDGSTGSSLIRGSPSDALDYHSTPSLYHAVTFWVAMKLYANS